MKIALWFAIIAALILMMFFWLVEKLFGYPAVFFQKICEYLTDLTERMIAQRRNL